MSSLLIFHIPQIIVQVSRIPLDEYNLLGHIVYSLMMLLERYGMECYQKVTKI